MEPVIEREAEGGFRLSPQQRRLWLLRSQDGASPYHLQRAYRVDGDLDPGRLATALATVAARYEILGTAFRCPPGLKMPLQRIGEALPPDLAARDLRGVRPDEEEIAVNALLSEAGGTDLDVERGPLLRLWLVQLPAGRGVLVARASALALDRTGLDRVLREVVAAYAGAAPVDDEQEEPLQYADLAEWQNGLLEAEESVAEREAWRQRDLAALEARLPFERRADGPRPFRPATVVREIDPSLAAALDRLAARSGVDTESLFLAVWGVLLARSTGRSEVVIGFGFSGRSYEGLETVPGVLARVVPLWFRNEEGWSLARLVRRVAREIAEAREAQEYFSWEPAVRFAPFGFELRGEDPQLAAGSVRLVPFQDAGCLDRFAVRLTVRWAAPPEGCHALEVHYDTEALAVEDAGRLGAQLETLLAQLAATDEGKIGDLDVLCEEERRQLLAVGDPEPLSVSGCVHRLFEEQAARSPERPALVWEDRTLSYTELNVAANRLAHRLRELGVRPDDRVALCLDRSHEMVVALLAVLKAGGAYLPLDPLLPAPRLRLFLGEAGARVLVTEERLLPTLSAPPEPGLPVVCLDCDRAEIARHSPADPVGGAEPGNLAYVLFTSGSTGVPKGVAVEHRQLANYLLGVTERLDLPAGGSFATVSTFAADLGNTMIFPALCFGGCLHVVASDRVSDPERFAEYLESRAVDCLKIVPSHLQALLGGFGPAGALPGRKLVLGGEALAWDLVVRVRELKPGCEVFNHYGPTETTVGVLACRAPAERQWDLGATVPLGRPLPGSQVHLLDSALRPVPTWVPGELYVGGAGLARGYLGRPDLTAERFVPCLAGAPGERLYRTGDLARRLPDGTVEHLGRVDGQVKIRGFRIEVGEIEALLRQHPDVREAVAVARQDGGGEPRLVAYVVPGPQRHPAPGDLREHLAARLPEVMVPSAFVLLKALPLNANGKVDRGALPAPEASRRELRNAYEPPANETEQVMVEIWRELLKVEVVGTTDDFFELGGHSLLGVQLISRLRETFQVEIPMRRVFEETTVRRLSQVVEEAVLAEIGEMSDEEAELLLGGAS